MNISIILFKQKNSADDFDTLQDMTENYVFM